MIKTAIIGCGRIAAQLEEDKYRYKPCTHLGAILRTNNLSKKKKFKIKGLCDLDVSKCKTLNKKYNLHSSIESDYKALLKKHTYDLVVIATHTNSHVAIATEAIKRGVLGIVIEKPVGLTYLQTKQLLKLSKKHNVQVWVNFERRYHPSYRYINKIILTKKLGEIRSIRGKVNTWSPPSSNAKMGTLLHDAIHWLDLLIWYVGTPTKIESKLLASKDNKDVEEKSDITLHYNSFFAHLETDSYRRYFEFSIEIDFKKGKIVSGNDGHKFYISKKSKLYEGFYGLTESNVKIKKKNPWLVLYKEVYKNLKNPRKGNPTTSLEDSLHTMKIIQSCYSNMKNDN